MMKKFYLTSITLLLASPLWAALTQNSFATRSVLAEGKWVKIGVESTGIYEISYERLRQMGFENPEAVSIYGNGGEQQSMNFVGTAGNVSINDDLTPIKVWHHEGKIYFYGIGIEKINLRLQRNITLQAYYNRAGRNIYSNKGYYFLTDSSQGQKMTQSTSRNTSSLPLIEKGLSYVYHENDFEQNTTATGQLFWGEDFCKSHEVTYPVSLPYALDNTTGYLQSDIYFGKNDDGKDIDGTFSYGLKGETPFTTPIVKFTTSNYRAQNPSGGDVGVSSGNKELFVSYESDELPQTANVDFWVLSYACRIPDLKDKSSLAQQRFGTTGLTRGSTYRIQIPDASSYALFNITDETSPYVILPENEGGNSSMSFTSTSSYGEFVIIDTSRPQLQISGYQDTFSPLANQNLHAHRDEGADMLIICIPRYREYAERIAELHREYEGHKVVVATTTECYNEFSSGVPDPMAYRSLAKMLYMGETPLKNILLLGPLFADFRGVSVEKDPEEGIIAFQNTTVPITRGASNVNDFIGMMTDYLNLDNLERATVEIGIGVLPIRFPEEAEICIKKIKDHLEDTSYAYRLNKIVNVGGSLDKNQHSRQAYNMGAWVASLDKGATISTPILVEAYGNREARLRLLEEFNHGITYMMYFGHGAEGMLGKDRNFFTTTDVNRLTNKDLPVTLFAGCLLSNSDRGRRGIGETIVTTTPYGALASVLPTRETWSGQNLEFYNSFFRLNFLEEDNSSSVRIGEPRTLGEILALLKTSSVYTNELSYLIIGDPMIKVPVANRNVTVTEISEKAIAGEDIIITGFVADSDEATADDGFNGEAVVRIMEPAYVQNCQNLISSNLGGEHLDTSPLPVEYAQTQLSMGVAEIKDGKFSVRLHIPGTARNFAGKSGNIHIAVYDPQRHIGGGSRAKIEYATLPEGETTTEEGDNIPPTVELTFNEAENRVDLYATDNYNLGFSDNHFNKSVTVWIDGNEFTSGNNYGDRLEDEGRALRRAINLSALDFGRHSLRVRVKDAAGNATENEITFDLTPGRNAYTLTVEKYGHDEDLRFGFEGNSPAKGILYITDAFGMVVASQEFRGGEIVWDRTLRNGAKATPGHYKAYIIEEGNSLLNGHSATIDITLI